jgi:hypothetical protein
MDNLAGTYDLEGEYAQSEALFLQTLEIMRGVQYIPHSKPDAILSGRAVLRDTSRGRLRSGRRSERA